MGCCFSTPLGIGAGAALGLIASTEGLAVLDAVLGRFASRSASF